MFLSRNVYRISRNLISQCKLKCYENGNSLIYNLHFNNSKRLISSFKPLLNNVLQTKLSPQQASEILKHNEKTVQLHQGMEAEWGEASCTPSLHSIASADSNQLASNVPIEDCLSVAKCVYTTGFLFGVFDGHGGSECSQVVSKRLFDYIAASLIPRTQLRQVVAEMEAGHPVQLSKPVNDSTIFISELQEVYSASLLQWCRDLLNSQAAEEDFSMEETLSAAFERLDTDISQEALEHDSKNSPLSDTLLRVAVSGCVACVAHIDGPHLHVASTGDCAALLGEMLETNESGLSGAGLPTGWVAQSLSTNHNWENATELRRVFSEHPPDEKDFVVNNQRLLGRLMPFRAFGDVIFKWDAETQNRVMPGKNAAFLRLVRTPPYLTARPEVKYHRLMPRARFLVLASDGLWDMMEPIDVATLVGEYMSGRQTLQPVQLPKRSVTLGEVASLLRKRRHGLRLKPSDTNASTHLIRHCLGGTAEGLDHTRLSHSLSLPPEVRRYFRDDISIHVIFLDSTFLRVCPMVL